MMSTLGGGCSENIISLCLSESNDNGIIPKKLHEGEEELEEMRRSRLDFVRIYRLLQTFLRNKTFPSSPECEKHRGRPHTYDDTLIIALWRLSYRETLETVSNRL